MVNEVIADKYISGIELYRKEGSKDEWFISKLTENALEGASSADAYQAIDTIIDFASNEHEGDLFYEHMQFIIALARKSDTTQPSESMQFNSGLLKIKAELIGEPQLRAVNEFCSWFRLI